MRGSHLKLALIVFVLVPATFLHVLNAAETKPNFVILFADDLGYGDVGYQGGDVPTPHIDSIAQNGVIMTDGYVTCPVCAPSRAGLLTGRYQQRFGFWDNIGPYRISKEIEPGIPTDVPILSERLKTLGYTCGLFGKTHDGDAEAMMAFNRWDEFYGFNNGASNYLGDMNRGHNPIFHNKKIVSSAYTKRGISHREVNRQGVLIRDTENYLTDKLGEMASRFIETNKDRPFLCYVPFNAIHGPFQAPKAMIDSYAHIKEKDRRIVMAMLESVDKNVGRVLDTLKKNDLMDKTMIIFLSDNGGHKASPNKPLRGGKGSYWEGGLRIPFCMRWDGHIKAGQSYKHAVSSLDIMPTLVCAASGRVKSSWALDGVDLMPYITGETSGHPHEALYWTWGPNKAIRVGDTKVVSFNDGKTYEMFDLSKDIGESNNIAGQHPETLNGLIDKHRQWEKGLAPQKWGWNKALGYKDPMFGKPRAFHDPDYYKASAADDKYLFILAGQSNMQGMNQRLTFEPRVSEEFGADNVLIVKEAIGGRPIRMWLRDWRPAYDWKVDPNIPGTKPPTKEENGVMYRSMMQKIEAEIQGTKPKAIAFCWMQGERDARERHSAVYEHSLKLLFSQLKQDFPGTPIVFVIGKLSDFGKDNKQKFYPEWEEICLAQENVAADTPHCTIFSTDDLNTGASPPHWKTKAVTQRVDDLHMSAQGYRILGTRFAGESIKLLQKVVPPQREN